jgi:hypothetical protein
MSSTSPLRTGMPACRQSYYNDPESDRWPVPKMLCVVDGGKEFSQTFRTGFAAELGPQVEVKWQTVPAGNPNAGAGQTENSNKQARMILRKLAQANRPLQSPEVTYHVKSQGI